MQATLRLQDGGLSFPSVRKMAAAAYAGSWALVMHEVAACLGVASLEELRTSCPLTTQAMPASEAEVRAFGGMGAAPFDWAGCLARPREKRQGHWCKAMSEHNRKLLLAQLGEDGRLALRGAGGPGAGSWLLPPQPGDPASAGPQNAPRA